MENLYKKPTINLQLDKRRAKQNNSYPLKFYIISNRKGKWYSTGISLTEKEYERINTGKYLSENDKKISTSITNITSHYHTAAANVIPFDFKEFEKKLSSKYYGIGENILQMFELVVSSMVEEERIKTASSYRTTMNVLKKFADTNSLAYSRINIDFLKRFESFVIKPKKKGGMTSIATLGIYLRNIRAIFNKAISENLISKEIYPFGRNKYEIRSKVRTKKAISLESIKKILTFIPESGSYEEKALDFWKFSFWTHGMNPKDIAKLKWKDIDQDGFSFYRAKTERTSKMQVPIRVTLSEDLKVILNRLGMGLKAPNEYVFPIYAEGMDAINRNNRACTYNKKVNKRVNALGVRLGISENLNIYSARHTFVHLLVYNNVPISAIKDLLGHTDSHTTENYVNSVEVGYQIGVIQALSDLVKV